MSLFWFSFWFSNRRLFRTAGGMTVSGSIALGVFLIVGGLLVGMLPATPLKAADPPPELFEEVAKLTALDAFEEDELGGAVDVDADLALIGARDDDDAGTDSGAAYLFARDEGGADAWGELLKLTASDAAAGDELGAAVALDGDLIAVGAPGESGDAGAVYLFARDEGGPDAWGQIRKLTAADAAAGDEFGGALALDGDLLVVGSRLDDDAGSASGSAYVFGRHEGGIDAWGQVEKLLPADGSTGDQFGYAVAVAGDRALVGAPFDNAAGSDSGSAYFFERDLGGPDRWGQVAKLEAPDRDAVDEFGTAVALAGDSLAIGAPGDDDAGLDAGAVHIFDLGGNGLWSRTAKVLASDAATEDAFGAALVGRGDILAVGAPFDNEASSDTGAVYLRGRDVGGAGAWGEIKKLTALDADAGDALGTAVAFDGRTVVAGAPKDNDDGANSGSAYIFGLFTPKLQIPAQLPAVYDRPVDVPVTLTTRGHALHGLAFSIDIDEGCLDLDPADNDLDGLPDAVVLNHPAHFTPSVFIDLGDLDGELDVLLAASDPAGAPLADGIVATVTLDPICIPGGIGEAIEAPLLFSTDPAPSMSDAAAREVLAASLSGSALVLSPPLGDCNGTGVVDVADADATVAEILDGDGTFWLDAEGGSFAGVPQGCDANEDTEIDLGDLAAVELLASGSSCVPAPLPPAAPRLELYRDWPPRSDRLTVSVNVRGSGSDLHAVIFSLDLDTARVSLDPADGDGDGIPDAVRLTRTDAVLRAAILDPGDPAGELELVISAASPFADGRLVELDLELLTPATDPVGEPVLFAVSPAVSFGDDACRRLAGETALLDGHLFNDGFESGDMTQWSDVQP